MKIIGNIFQYMHHVLYQTFQPGKKNFRTIIKQAIGANGRTLDFYIKKNVSYMQFMLSKENNGDKWF